MAVVFVVDVLAAVVVSLVVLVAVVVAVVFVYVTQNLDMSSVRNTFPL